MNKIIEVVAAVIEKDNKILATQRGYGEFKGKWEFPGGKIQNNESKEEALKREIREELNADISVDKYLTTIEYDYPNFHLIIHTYICSLNSDIYFVYHDDNEFEYDNMVWLAKEDLESLDWLPADIEIISAYREDINKKDTLTNEELAMLIALIISRGSKDPHTKVGSCILSEENELLSIGYNNSPKKWQGEFPWNNNKEEVGEENTKYPYVIHSEVNALNKYRGPKEMLENATIYVTLFPCSNCAKQIVESGIKRVVYKDDYYKNSVDNYCAKKLLTQCGVEYIQFKELSNMEEYTIPVAEKVKIYL